jgi:hypothetical protein
MPVDGEHFAAEQLRRDDAGRQDGRTEYSGP